MFTWRYWLHRACFPSDTVCLLRYTGCIAHVSPVIQYVYLRDTGCIAHVSLVIQYVEILLHRACFLSDTVCSLGN